GPVWRCVILPGLGRGAQHRRSGARLRRATWPSCSTRRIVMAGDSYALHTRIRRGTKSRPKRSVSGGLGRSEGEVDGLVAAERLAVGVSTLELLLTEGGPHVAEAVMAVVRFGFLPVFSGPV